VCSWFEPRRAPNVERRRRRRRGWGSAAAACPPRRTRSYLPRERPSSPCRPPPRGRLALAANPSCGPVALPHPLRASRGVRRRVWQCGADGEDVPLLPRRHQGAGL
jgi:hypothetical protein